MRTTLVGNAQAPRNVDPSSALCGRRLKALRGRSGAAGRKPLPTLAKDHYWPSAEETKLESICFEHAGEALMPCSAAKARILLKEKKAAVARRTPFTIRLTTAGGELKQPVSLGVDAGYKHVGLSASTEKAELYASEIELRQDITDLLSARLALRRARRSRKTRYRAPRFDNRVRSKRKGWLAPSVENRIAAHFSRIEAVLRILPVTKITVETASFDMQLLKNPDIPEKAISRANSSAFGMSANTCSSETGMSAGTAAAGRRIRCSTFTIWNPGAPAAIRQAI